MKFKKPYFWDYKKPNLFAYLLLPFTYLIKLINFINKKEKIKSEKIKTICIGNIYLGGTGKTPISIKINKILNNLNFKTAFVKKKYHNQEDEQKILSSHGKLFCKNNRIDALKDAVNEDIEVAIFDDGLQDKILNYDIAFVCFNTQTWIGNNLCIPSGPLRESLKSLKKYDAVFLNGNGEETIEIESILKNIKPNLEIFVAEYMPLNIEEIDINQNYLAFSGIGNPDSFLKTLKKNNFKILKTLNFSDHYNYSDKDIAKIKETAKNLKAKIVTTEKDYNRLNKLNAEGINFLKIELKILNEKQFIDFLNKKL
jgi:tetraacyldisaccharide 4'-kinase